MLKLMRKFWVIASIATLSVSGMTSCSDDDEPTPDPGTQPDVEEELFPHGRYLAQGMTDISFNEDGTVESIKWEELSEPITFEYYEPENADTPDVIMNINNVMYNIFLNDAGFAEKIIEDRGSDKCGLFAIKYNADNQVNYVNYLTGSEDDRYIEMELDYSNGDIVSTTYTWIESGEISRTTIFKYAYTNSNITSPIDNIGGLMFFGYCYTPELLQFDFIYLAGFLGKSTKHLPAQMLEEEDMMSFDWKLNSTNLPTICKITFGDETNSTAITWL